MKRICILLSLLTTHFSLITCHAAVPLRWTVETSRLQPVAFDVVRGETLALEAEFNSYGKPVAMTNHPCCIFWQTNGMGNAWWTSPASATELAPSVLNATFTPQMDPGAPTVNGFLGSTGQIYRAAFTLRFRHGPGAAPNVIDQPPRILDLAHTVVVNPPWPTRADFAETTTVMRAELKTYVDEQITGAGLVTPTTTTNIAGKVVSNVVTKAYVEGLGIEAGVSTQNATNIAQNVVRLNIDTNLLCTVEAAQEMTNDATIVRGVLNEYNLWDIHVTESAWASIAGSANNVNWSNVSDRPATLSGYGITDGISNSGGTTEDTFMLDSPYGSILKCQSGERHFISMGWENAQMDIFTSNTYVHGNMCLQNGWDYIKTQEETLPEYISSTSVTNGGAKAYADATFRTKTDNVCHADTFTEWSYSGSDVPSGVKEMIFEDLDMVWILFVDGGEIYARSAMGHSKNDTLVSFSEYGAGMPADIVATRSKSATSGQPFVTADNIPSTNGFITANVATNAVKAVVCDVMEYGLTNLAANTETFALASGVIGNLALDSAHTNINLTILYPASTSKSADILLRVVNAADADLAINSADTDVDGTDWTKVKAGTNYVSATRTAYDGGRSKVLVNVKGL